MLLRAIEALLRHGGEVSRRYIMQSSYAGRELIIKRKNNATDEFDIVCVVEERSLNIRR